MTLDVWLVARLCAELQETIVGARIQGVAVDAGGLRLTCYRRGGLATLRATSGGDGPLLAFHPETAPANESAAAGWAGGVAPLLRGSTVESVQAVADDRVVFLDVVSRSPFGVPARHRVAYELEPNKANVLVLRPGDAGHWQILAAAKEIRGGEGARSIVVGETYTPPPPRRPRLDRSAFVAVVRDAPGERDRVLVRALGEYDVTCSPMLGREVLERASDNAARPLEERLLGAWSLLRREVAANVAEVGAPVFGWQDGDGFRVVHVVRLGWPPGTPVTLTSVNEACARQQLAADRHRGAPALGALVKRLETMLVRCSNEAASLKSARRKAGEADALRLAGEAIYAYLPSIPERAPEFVTPEGLRVALDPSLTAKENAASYFRRFKKARSGLPRIDERLAVLEKNRVYWEELLWQARHAAGAPIEEATALADELGQAIGVRRAPKKAQQRRATPPRAVELADDATAFVGRSPKDNERVTFVLGGPDDWWFHTRGVPGAHVILKLGDTRGQPTEEQIVGAASLAAGQSAAADANAVEVDYTQRKHVRKQGGGRVGLVWYTDFKTVRVPPRKL